MSIIATAVAGLSALLMASPATLSMDPPKVELELNTYSGNGCPGGSVTSYPGSEGKHVLHVNFTKFTVKSTEPARPAARTCDFTIGIKNMKYYKVALTEVIGRGSFSFAPTGRGKLTTSIAYNADGEQVGSGTWVGSHKGSAGTESDFFTHVVSNTGKVWSKCGSDPQIEVRNLIEAETDKSGNAASVDLTAQQATMTLKSEFIPCTTPGK